MLATLCMLFVATEGESRPIRVPVSKFCPESTLMAIGATQLFVDPTAAPGGDGTLATPKSSLNEVMVPCELRTKVCLADESLP